MFKTKNHHYKIIFGVVIFCLAVVITFWLRAKVVDTQVLSNEAVLTPVDLLAALGKLVVLPNDEEPTIATVTDLTELQKQEFFRQAKVGDKVIIYPKAGKAILYSPSTNKIVEMAPINQNLIK